MGQLFKLLVASAWLLLGAVLTVQPAHAQSAPHYPPADEAWDGTDYRGLLQRVETRGLALPTLAGAATKPIFDRMVNVDNIPLRVGLNREMPVTIRFQKLDSALDPIHKLVVLYSSEMQKGKPYATELARLMVYETKVSAALLEVSDPFLATLKTDKRYQVHVAINEQLKNSARQVYSGLVHGTTETQRYSKPEILKMISGAIADLPSYQPVLTDQDRQELTQKLAKQISATTDQELKKSLTELRDAIEHRRVRT
jgi:hypothetical protein